MLPIDGTYCKVEGADYGFTPLFDMLSLQFVKFILIAKKIVRASLRWLSGDAFGVWVVLNS